MFSAWILWKTGGKAKYIILCYIWCHQTPPSHITGVCNYFLQVAAEQRLRASTEVTEDSLWNLEGRSICTPPLISSLFLFCLLLCSKILTWQIQNFRELEAPGRRFAADDNNSLRPRPSGFGSAAKHSQKGLLHFKDRFLKCFSTLCLCSVNLIIWYVAVSGCLKHMELTEAISE